MLSLSIAIHSCSRLAFPDLLEGVDIAAPVESMDAMAKMGVVVDIQGYKACTLQGGVNSQEAKSQINHFIQAAVRIFIMRSYQFLSVLLAALVGCAMASPVPQFRNTPVNPFGFTPSGFRPFSDSRITASDDSETVNAGSANGGSVSNNAPEGIITNDGASCKSCSSHNVLHECPTNSIAIGGVGGSLTSGTPLSDGGDEGRGDAGNANGGDVTNTGDEIDNSAGSSIGGAGGTSTSPAVDADDDVDNDEDRDDEDLIDFDSTIG